MRRSVWLCAALLFVGGIGADVARAGASSAVRVSTAPAGFWEHWGDGKAEIDRYRIVQARYGEARDGEAVWIFVTEDFTAKTNVKSDGGHGDEFPVLKLNDIRGFQTGLYAYSTMTSTFSRLDGGSALGVPVKVSLSVQEWCGHVYEQWVLGKGVLDRVGHSYFDGEADFSEQIRLPKRAIFADALPVLVRGLTGDLVAPGGAIEVQLLPRGIDKRLGYVPELDWLNATVKRSASKQVVEVPAGTFETYRTTVEVDGAMWMAFEVEAAAPQRVIAWETAAGERGELMATRRSAYWRESKAADEPLWEAMSPSN